MKKFLKFSLILALTVFTFSCSNDNTDVIPDDTESTTEGNAALKANFTTYARTAVATNQAETVFENNNDNSDVIDDYPTENCFTLNFPYTVTNGNVTATVNSQAEADNFFNAGYTVAFPVTITLTDGSEVIIADELGLIEALEDCLGDEIISVGNDCFEFNFPLSVETEDGNTVVVNSDVELYTVEGAIGFVYPITVTTENGVVTIGSDADFDAIYNDCYDIDPCDDCGANCFEIVYPITLLQDDGTVTTVNDDDEFIMFLDGLDADDYFVPIYPMNIEYEDGTQATINSDDELAAAFDACDD